jgi:hypothetical protein
MMPVSKPYEIKRVRIKALTPNFYLNGHVAEVGEEGIVDHGDAVTLIAQKKAEIIGNAAPRIIAMKDLKDPPPLRRTV